MKIKDIKKQKRANFGLYIRQVRIKKNIKPKEMADKLGVSVATVYYYEQGRSMPVSRIDDIAEALDMSKSDLQKIYLES